MRDFIPSVGVNAESKRKKGKSHLLTLMFVRYGTIKFHLKKAGLNADVYFFRQWNDCNAKIVISQQSPVVLIYDQQKHVLNFHAKL